MSREELFGGSYLGGKTSGGNCPGTTFIGEGGAIVRVVVVQGELFKAIVWGVKVQGGGNCD